MELLTNRYQAELLGVLSCYDRIIINGTYSKELVVGLSFEGAVEANTKAAHGRSKEKRSDCALVMINRQDFVTRNSVQK